MATVRNQHYYTCDVIGIKMTYRDLPYYEGMRAKTRRENKLYENKHKNHTNPLHTFTKWFSSFYPVLINVGLFAIQWCVLSYTAHVILRKFKMVDQTRITDM